MGFKTEVADRISFGNKKLVILNLTDVQNDGTSTIRFGQNAWAVKAINNTDTADTFKETVGAKSGATRNLVTFTSVTNDDDGHAWIIYD